MPEEQKAKLEIVPDAPKVSLFKARDYVEAMSPPAFEDLDGEVHIGRLLSFEEVLPLQEKLDQLTEETVDVEKMKAIITEICEKVNIPAEKVLALPPKVMMRAVLHFFTSMFGQESSKPVSSPDRK